jgi:tetratricopeptide (TPR) repeat protein
MESQLAMMKGNMEEAETLVLEALKQDPEAVSLRITHAEILLQKGDYGKARETLEAVLREDPAQADALNLLSSLSAARQDWARSEEYMRRAYALHKSESNAYMLAQTLARQERFAEAAEVLKGYSSPASLKMLAALYHALGDARSEEAALQELHGKNPADREVIQSLASLHEQEERPLQAARLLEKIPPQDRSSDLRIRMASLYRRGGDCARALELLAGVPPSSDPDPESDYEKAQCRVQTGDWEAAEETLVRTIGAGQRNILPQFLLLRLRLLDGRLDEAEQMLSPLQTEHSTSPMAPFIDLEKALWLQLKGDDSAAVRLLGTLLEDPDTRIEAGRNLYEIHRARGCPGEALATAEALWRKDPGSGLYPRLAARAWLEMGDLQSGALFLRHIEEDLGSEGYAEAGWLLTESGFPGEALNVVREMEERYGPSRESRFLSAGAHEKLGEWGKAEGEFKALLKDHPGDASALNYLGYMLTERSSRFAEAREYIEKALRLQPDSGAFLDSLGWVQFALKDYPAAYENLTRAFRKEPLDATVLEHLGDAAIKTGRTEEALRRYRMALRLRMNNADRLIKKIAPLLRN